MDNSRLLIGNIIALIASILMIITGTIKNSKKILICQNIQIGITAVSSIVLGGYTGVFANILSIIRNTLCYKKKLDNKAKIIIAIILTIGTFIINDIGLIGFCPLIVNLIYMAFLNNDAKRLKILAIVSMLFWAIYNFSIKSYVSFGFNVFTIFTNLIGLYQINRKGE